MRLRVVSEKRPYRELQHTKKTGLTIIVCLLNLLLWLSLFVIGSTLFVTISISNSSETVLVPAIVTVTTVSCHKPLVEPMLTEYRLLSQLCTY